MTHGVTAPRVPPRIPRPSIAGGPPQGRASVGGGGAMAQIGKREFDRIAGAGGMREGAGAARSRLAAALRIDC